MIFKSVSQLVDIHDKKVFIELINVYIRLVEVYCERNKVSLNNVTKLNKKLLVSYWIEIGIIKEEADIVMLKKMLGQEKYNRFLICSEFAVENANNIGDLLDKLNNSKRKEYQKMNENKYTLVDFFCGAGGLSLGFIQQGFNVKLANDIEDVCIETYLYNHPQLSSKKIIKGDIKEIVDNVESYLDTDIDVVVGGPPCQGFSSANQQRIIDDPRNKLYKYFIQAVEKIVPKFVVMENVRGMLKVADQVVEDYKNLKTEKDGIEYTYDVSYELLNAKDFSVAQSRERLIYIAIRNDVIDSLNISPDEIFKEIKEDCSDNLIFTLNDALMDIKPLEAQRIKNMNEVDDKKTGKKIDVNEFGLTNNPYLNLINEGRPIHYIFNHKSRYVNDINYEIYRRLNEGEDATNEKIADIMPYANRNHIFKDKYYKLIANKPSRTITAHLRMDCHSHIHPYQVRSITPREAARIQSFPDDYLFLGPYLKTYMQIGNAVPPLLARGIAKVIKKYL